MELNVFWYLSHMKIDGQQWQSKFLASTKLTHCELYGKSKDVENENFIFIKWRNILTKLEVDIWKKGETIPHTIKKDLPKDVTFQVLY